MWNSRLVRRMRFTHGIRLLGRNCLYMIMKKKVKNEKPEMVKTIDLWKKER